MAPYIVGYYRDLGIDANMSEFYLVLPLIVIVSTVFFPFGMWLTEKINSRYVILLGAIIVVGTVFYASLAVS